MRLLIVTQAIDRNDPALGFFISWIEEFSKSVETLEIICLKKGEYTLPSNVKVYSLGKETKISRLRYVYNFYRYLWQLRGTYDAVLVHMNEEYVLLGGMWWLCARKKIGLWRNHVQRNWKIAIARHIAHVLFYTSPHTYVARFASAHQMPVGIDTTMFVPLQLAPARTILSLGRIDSVKNIHLLLEALSLLAKENVPFAGEIIGTATPGREAYEKEIKERFQDLQTKDYITYRPGVRFEDTPHLYATHRIFVNLTPPGSFDKTILEAAACGAVVVVSNPALAGVVDPSVFVNSLTPEDIAQALRNALAFTPQEHEIESKKLQNYVAAHHSLSALVREVLAYLTR